MLSDGHTPGGGEGGGSGRGREGERAIGELREVCKPLKGMCKGERERRKEGQ